MSLCGRTETKGLILNKLSLNSGRRPKVAVPDIPEDVLNVLKADLQIPVAIGCHRSCYSCFKKGRYISVGNPALQMESTTAKSSSRRTN
jgi:hypothetical protein